MEISSQQTLFWRYQTGKPSTYLATIEALYYFVLAVHKLQEHTPSRRRGLQRKTGDELEETTQKQQGPTNQTKFDGEAASLQRSEESLESPPSSNQQGAVVSDHKAGQHALDYVKHVPSSCNAIELPSISKGCNSASVPGNDPDAKVEISLSDDFEGIKISENKLQFMHRETNVNEDSSGILKDCFTNSNGSSGAPVARKLIASSVDQEIETSNVSALLINDSLYTDACCHQYDNMLFFFKFMFYKIHNLYGSNNLRAYK